MNNLRNLILLKGYNNYFNRIIKIEDLDAATNRPKIEKYKEAAESFSEILNVNFNPNDSVTTSIVVNCEEDVSQSDYLLVVNFDNAPMVSESNWFIISAKRIRGGQYQLDLKRDVIADKYSSIVESPCFISKATLSSPTSPLLYNSEGMRFNQIKKEETLLKDSTGTPWIVFYTNKDPIEQSIVPSNVYNIVETLDTPIEQWDYYGLKTLPLEIYEENNNNFFGILIANGTNIVSQKRKIYKFRINDIYQDLEPEERSSLVPSLKSIQREDWAMNLALEDAFLDNAVEINQAIDSEFYNNLHTQTYNDILKYRDKYVKDSNNKIYRIGIQEITGRYKNINKTSGDLVNSLIHAIKPGGTFISGFSGSFDVGATFSVGYYFKYVYLTISEVQNATLDIDTTGKTSTRDSVYNLTAIPYYTNGDLYIKNGNSRFKMVDGKTVLDFATQLMTNLAAKGYDFQLLPYCPIQGIITSQLQDNDLTIDITNLSTENYSFITSSSSNKAIALSCPEANFTFNIAASISVPEYSNNRALDYKISNECDMYRLVSPNYNGQFEFNLARNGGIDFFNVDCTYRPFSPYIHINPNFSNLYGRDFDDARGLICGGDFSLPLVSDAWINYQQQNKNYQNIFDRQIAQMDLNNKLNNISNTMHLATNVATSALAGSLLKSGSPGIIAGAAIGLGTSIADIEINKSRQKENKDYAIDMYNYQLGNIQAMPESLTRVSAYNANNKIFPILEFYSCTDEEKEAFKNKLKYDGMTIMTIGKISDYIQSEKTYIKGNMIRLETIFEDTHYLNEVYDEIAKGVFI